MMREATVLIVPGLRDHVPQHWQTLLASRLPRVRTVEPMGREDLDCARRVAAIERDANAINGPLLLVAHSGGVVTAVHWAKQTQRAVHGALLATPPDFERAMPAEYPTIDELRAGGWLPVPRNRLPFRSIVAASRRSLAARRAAGRSGRRARPSTSHPRRRWRPGADARRPTGSARRAAPAGRSRRRAGE